ncbi:MAG: TauD/TfdA family dioxygenase [Novosphingobium sp.]|nr:TauD/TfdA family dioxygenase [Novosphingobium sp.]
MVFTVSRLREDLEFGALVTDLDPAAIGDPATRKALYDLWIDKGVVVFRGLPDDGDTQIALSRVFGKPARHPLKFAARADTVDELVDIYYVPERGDIVRIGDGPSLGAWLPWHFDLVYVDRINHGGILRPIELPATGGATGFIDGLEAYGRLPDALKAEIEDLYVVYHFDADIAGLRYGKTPGVVLERMNPSAVTVMDRLAELPPVAHPLVFTQEETGRKVLNFSPWFSLGIEGMDRAASDRILGEVLNVLIDEDNAYFHEWRPGDMVLWDNWRIVHSATGIPAEQRRHMQRTTIEGDYGLGRPSTWAEQLEQA